MFKGIIGKQCRSNLCYAAAFLLCLSAAAVFLSLVARAADKSIRNDLLVETRMVAGSINLSHILALSGTEQDLSSPHYLRLKEQLGRVRTANKNCRFIYLMGRNPEGSIFFYADSEPAGSEDESPAGQIFTEASPQIHRVFLAKQEAVIGPVEDRWGTWVSAFVPLFDDQSGKLTAVLGMDIDAKRWKRIIARQSALPAGSLFILLLSLIFSVVILRIKERVRVSESKYRQLFEENNDAIFIADPVTRRLVDCNKKAETITGRTRKELLSMHADQLHPEDKIAETMEAFKKQASGLLRAVDSEILTKDAKRINVSINATILEIEGVPYVMGVFRDLTERKQAEESLRQSEERYRGMVDNIGIGVALISPEMEILSLNNQMKKWFPHIDLKDRHICYRAFNRPPREETCSYCPTVKTLKDGLVHEDVTETPVGDQIINYRIVSSPVKDQAGKVIMAIEMVEDITARKRAEQALKERELLLSKVGDIAKIGGWEMDIVTGKATWTKGTYDIVEIEYDKPVPGLHEHAGYYLPEYRGMVEKKMSELIETRQPMMFEAALKSAKGRIKWCQAIGEVVELGGRVVKLRGTFQDITERKDAEKALMVSEEKFRALFEHSQDGVLLIHPQQGVVDCNASAVRIFALSGKEELIGRHLAADFSPDMQPGSIPSGVLRDKHIEEVRQKGFSTFEWVYKRKDGNTFTAEVIMSTVAYGGESILQAVLRDISERKRVDEALRYSEAQLSNALKIAHLGPWELDIEKNLFTFNDAFYALFRTSAEEMGGYLMTPAEYARRFLYPEDVSLVVTETQKALEATDPNFSRQFEHRIIYADGDTGYITVRFFIVKDEQGKTIKTYGVNQDITERKRAEEEIKRAYQELKATQAQLIQSNKMSALGQLAGGLAHELNNPLTGVLNNVQLIKMEAGERKDFSLDDFKELMDAVENSALRCKNITQSLLEFTHAAKGEFQEQSLNELVKKTIALVAQELKLSNVIFREDLQPGLPSVKGDSQLLQQVLYGLIANAHWAIMKKEGEEGVITVKTRHDPLGKTVHVSVSDTGIGIPEENLPRLFTPFFTTKDVGEGTGLGLALFYNIIKTHGGDITVESREGAGATFTVSLPCCDPEG
ncbi:MAG: PAS domain S-box protein [Candidatus Omnitrophica bacterium]|nr:PAS domain S-box protein [Candidatus Omnitrophota bacterium]